MNPLIVLAAIVGLVIGGLSGAYVGAYNSEPILSAVIDSQAGTISYLEDNLDEYRGERRSLKNNITDLEETVEDLKDCFYDSDGTRTKQDLLELTTCIEEMEDG